MPLVVMKLVAVLSRPMLRPIYPTDISDIAVLRRAWPDLSYRATMQRSTV